MKKSLLLSSLLLSISTLFAQVQDSVSLSNGNPNYPYDVFYNLATGSKDTVLNTNWHLAFAVRTAQPPSDVMRSATIRINESRSVSVYKSSQTSFSAFDTAGYASWPMLHDSDSSWDAGGFNAGANVQQFNFGWGNYDMGTHDVNGTHVYLVKIGNTFKKLWLNKLAFDTTWIFTSANLDGTDSVASTINKSGFQGKLFAYHNLQNHTTMNREPNRPWDLLFTQYRKGEAFPGFPFAYYNFVGVLAAPQVSIAEIRGVPEEITDTASVTAYEKNIGTIGWDWKLQYFGPPANPWGITDSLSYFMKKDNDSVAYKMVFTAYGFAPSNIVFNKWSYKLPEQPTTGVATNAALNSSLVVYPNPANGVVNISLDNAAANVSLIDITGKMVSTSAMDQGRVSFNTASLDKGIYFVRVETAAGTAVRKLIIE